MASNHASSRVRFGRCGASAISRSSFVEYICRWKKGKVDGQGGLNAEKTTTDSPHMCEFSTRLMKITHCVNAWVNFMGCDTTIASSQSILSLSGTVTADLTPFSPRQIVVKEVDE